MRLRKKLIEVSLPLEAINEASAREKSIRHGHPSTLHLWWARRPLAAARAVIFAQMVDDPSEHPELFPTAEEQARERERLFRLIEELVKWENTTNEELLEQAREEIRRSWCRTCADNRDHPRAAELFDPDRLPAFHDPFAGGGSLPLEAQRLGLEAHASDLNPVAVLICKAMIEIPPKFAGQPPINPECRSSKCLFDRDWRRAEGLAEDVRYYGQWMRDRGEERIGHLYARVRITPEKVKERPDLKKYEGRELTVIAWLWARTVRSPNPAFSPVQVPLVSNFMLSTKRGKEAYVEPVIEGDSYRFKVLKGKPPDLKEAKKGTKLGRGANFRCVVSGSPIEPDYIYAEATQGRMQSRLMAMVLEGDRERVYLSPPECQEFLADQTSSSWKPELPMPENPRWFSPPLYGLPTYGDLFAPRQLIALTTFSDLVQEVRAKIRDNALAAGIEDDGRGLADGGIGATAYGEAVSVYCACALGRAADYWNANATWEAGGAFVAHAFTRQALPMIWDFAESNPFSDGSGNWNGTCTSWVVRVVERLGNGARGFAFAADAQVQSESELKVISTDPPYYDNVGYADLSDFFYVWMRRSLGDILPELFSTIAAPKEAELVATPYRHGSRQEAETFFLDGMTRAMRELACQGHAAFPISIYYAFKQSERDSEGISSTGWETFLDAVMRAGFGVSGTWPVRTERQARSVGIGTNALASSIILVCRRREITASMATRREFLSALKGELPNAIADLQRGNIAPVDLAQASIGPGMAIFTRYSQVKESDGSDMSVRTALQLINQILDETLTEQESDFDPDTRWALAWFSEFGVDLGPYGRAETLSTAKNTSVSGMVEAGILAAGRGKVRLLSRDELGADWDPREDPRLTIWEVAQHLIRELETGGETAAASLLACLGGGIGESARELAYRLYAICEKKKWVQEAIAYNSLVTAWPEILRISREAKPVEPAQVEAF